MNKAFEVTWKTGKKEEVVGEDIGKAMMAAGYSRGVLRAIDSYKEVPKVDCVIASSDNEVEQGAVHEHGSFVANKLKSLSVGDIVPPANPYSSVVKQIEQVNGNLVYHLVSQ